MQVGALIGAFAPHFIVKAVPVRHDHLQIALRIAARCSAVRAGRADAGSQVMKQPGCIRRRSGCRA